MKYKTLILDFNGTLLDDRDCCLKILNILTKEHNLVEVSKEKYLDIFTFPVSEYYESLGFDLNDGKFNVIGAKFHKIYDTISPTEAEIFSSARSLLDELQGKIRLVCLSASRLDTLKKQLEYYGILSYFDDIVGISDKLARGKKEVAISWMNEQKIDPSTALMVGDSIHDKEVADAIQVDCILLATGHTSKTRLIMTNAIVLDDLLELKKHL